MEYRLLMELQRLEKNTLIIYAPKLQNIPCRE